MRLVMFDIDGTLTETMKVDEERFVRSFAEVFGLTDIDADWSHYPHVTDSGIFHEVYAPRMGRLPTALGMSRSGHSVHRHRVGCRGRATCLGGCSSRVPGLFRGGFVFGESGRAFAASFARTERAIICPSIGREVQQLTLPPQRSRSSRRLPASPGIRSPRSLPRALGRELR